MFVLRSVPVVVQSSVMPETMAMASSAAATARQAAMDLGEVAGQWLQGQRERSRGETQLL